MKEARGIWSYVGRMRLMEVRHPDGRSAPDVYKKLQKRYASYNDRTGYPKMWNGPMMMLKFPCHYMGFIVSSDVVFSLYKDGRGTVGANLYQQPDYFSYCAAGGHGTWYFGIPDGMYYFSTYLNREQRRFTFLLSFTVLLTIGSYGSTDAELLLPEQPDEATRQTFDAFREYVRRLRPNLFQPFFTSDAACFRPASFRFGVVLRDGRWPTSFPPLSTSLRGDILCNTLKNISLINRTL